MYHNGEKEIQKRVGEEAQAHITEKVINNTIIRGAIPYIEKQQMVIVSSVDAVSNTWVSLLMGVSGFVSVIAADRLSFNKALIVSSLEDIFFKNICKHLQIGMLFIELSTRRRFRVNGIVSDLGECIDIKVQEAYPNCPKYIQQRTLSLKGNMGYVPPHYTTGTVLTHDVIAWIHSSDTLFVGSSSSNGRMDASHRGGSPGFVEVLADNTLKIPDYRGNSMYNTLGNFVQNPDAGILFIDFQQGKTLQLTGKATVQFNQVDAQSLTKTAGTGRYWFMEVNKWIITENHPQANWKFIDYSPFNP